MAGEPYCVLCVHWSPEFDPIVEDSRIHGPYPSRDAAETDVPNVRDRLPDRGGWTFQVTALQSPSG